MSDLSRQLLEYRDNPDKFSDARGLLSQAARALAAVQTDETDDDKGCRGCGSPLTPQPRGRPRKWCQAPECQRASRNGGKSAGKRRMRQI